MKARALAVFALAALACNAEIRGLREEAEPVAIIRGHIRVQLTTQTCNLRAGILWAATPVFLPFCHEFGRNPNDPERHVSEFARHRCRDPREFVPRANGPSVPITFDQTDFEIRLQHLPETGLLAGEEGSRVAYGALIIYDDFDANGELTFGATCARGDDPPPLQMNCLGSSYRREKIWASSFVTLEDDQTRITYVEGAFDRDSLFYPHPGCANTPPPGFSLWHVAHWGATEPDCSVESLDEPIVLGEPFFKLDNLSCKQRRSDTFPRPPDRAKIDQSWAWVCERPGELAVADTDCECPNVRLYTLRGCFNELDCESPDWDLPPIPEWPCLGGDR